MKVFSILLHRYSPKHSVLWKVSCIQVLQNIKLQRTTGPRIKIVQQPLLLSCGVWVPYFQTLAAAAIMAKSAKYNYAAKITFMSCDLRGHSTKLLQCTW